MRLTAVLLATLLACTVCGYPSGPPADSHYSEVCVQMTPSPHDHGSPQSGHGGYLVSVEPAMTLQGSLFIYKPSQDYTIKIVGTTDSFRGFLLQARDPSKPPPSTPILIGHFSALSEGSQTLSCDPAGVANTATVGHSNSHDRSSVQFTWTAPSNNGTVDFFYTIVRKREVHFDRLSAASLGPPPVEASPGNTLPPIKTPEQYRLHFTTPDNCQRTACVVYVAIDTNRGNASYLDIYMEGSAAGWLAVGFSLSANMYSSDVVACNRHGSDIASLDLYTPERPHRDAIADSVQDVYLFEGNYSNGRLSCKTIKGIYPSDEHDILLNQPLYVLFGRRSADSAFLMNISRHDHTPEVSPDMYNVVMANGSSGGNGFEVIKSRLIKTHGIFMLIAYPLLAVSAIFFPVFMKPALPKGEWFHAHRVLMLLSISIGVAGFILVFIAHMHQPTPGLIPLGVDEPVRTTHFVFGVAIMALHLLNPFIALCRCKPDSPRRWIFNIVHGRVVGLGTLLLALMNVGIGAWLVDYAPLFWVVISWEAIFLIVIGTLLIVFTVLAVRSRSDRSSNAPSMFQGLFKRAALNNDSLQWSANKGVTVHEKAPLVERVNKTPPPKGRVLRWISFVVFLSLSIPILLAAMLLIGVAELD